MSPDCAYGGAGLPSRMSGYCLSWISVATLVGKSVQFVVVTLTVIFGWIAWNAAATPSQYLVEEVAGVPVP